MLLWGAAYVAAHLQGMFPPGTHAVIDRVYQIAPYARIAAWSLAALWAAYGWRRGRRTALAFAGVTAVAGAFDFLPLIVVTIPWSFAKEASVDPRPSSPWFSGILTTTAAALIAGAALATFAVNLSYYFVARDIWYMGGLCVLLVGAYAVYGYFVADVAGRIKTVTTGPAMAAAFAVACVAGPFYAAFAPPLETFTDKLAMGKAPLGFAALLTTLFFALTTHPALLAKMGRFFWLTPLGRGWRAGLKAVVVILVLRVTAKLVREGEQDIGWEVLRDVTNVLTPLLVLLVAAQIVGTLALWLRVAAARRPFYIAALVVCVFGSIAPVAMYRQAAWARDLEQARPFAVYATASVRRAFGALGLPNALGATAEDDRMHALVDSPPPCPQCGNGVDADDTVLAPILTSNGRRPNIFFFVSDATARDRLGVYGYERDNSPNLKDFARDAVVFHNYFAVSSATFQNVATFFSGEYVGRRPALPPAQHVRLCEALNAAGYKILMAEVPYSLFDIGKLCTGAVKLSAEGNTPADFEILSTSMAEDPDRPHFVYMHVKGGHNPWSLPAEDQIYGSDYRDIYDALLRVADRQFGELVAFLRSKSVYDDSVVIFSADHGIGLGYHYDKSSYSNLYAHNLAVPFLMHIPGVPAGEDRELRSHLDFAPTLVQISGALSPTVAFPGRSILKRRGPPTPRCVFAIAEYKGAVASLCSDKTKVVWDFDRRTLSRYSLDDPNETDSVPFRDAAEFRRVVAPLAQFVAKGRGTYIDHP